MNAGMKEVQIRRIQGNLETVCRDRLAVEEPLEIVLGCTVEGERVHRSISVTMRTPGADAELAVGFLFSEGIVRDRDQIQAVRPCIRQGNSIRVDLRPEVTVDLARLERHFYTSSSCGVCGKVSIESVRVAPQHRFHNGYLVVSASLIHRLPGQLRAAQRGFDHTGGLHASGLFDIAGRLLALREDVGRHNALDKLLGGQFLTGGIPLVDRILLLSGRASFELVQKAAMAGIPIVAAVGAPSSLAVELAREHGMTLLGFVRDDRMNIYSGEARIQVDASFLPAMAVPLASAEHSVLEPS
jgi:FdhD protein